MVSAAGRSEVTGHLSPVTHAIAVALASLAFNIRGFGQIKLKNYRAVKTREAARSCASCAVRRRRYSRQRGSEALDVRCRRDIVRMMISARRSSSPLEGAGSPFGRDLIRAPI